VNLLFAPSFENNIAPPLSVDVQTLNIVFKASVPDINIPCVLVLLNEAYIAPPDPDVD
jgi:hypothetical protein